MRHTEQIHTWIKSNMLLSGPALFYRLMFALEKVLVLANEATFRSCNLKNNEVQTNGELS